MVGRFTRHVCLGPRTACHCLAPSPWSSSRCPLTLLRERSSRLEFPWPEVSQGHCIPQRPEILERDSELLTERAGDCACELLALSARGRRSTSFASAPSSRGEDRRCAQGPERERCVSCIEHLPILPGSRQKIGKRP